MRSILMFFVLAAPAFAGPGTWKVVEQGDRYDAGMKTEKKSGNAKKLEASAGALRSRVDTDAETDFTSADEGGAAQSDSTSWYTLSFAGSADTTDHRWKITSRVHGDGEGHAYANLDCDAWADTLQIIQVSGDDDNRALGQIAVDDTGGVSYSLGVPVGFRVSLNKKSRTRGQDVFSVDTAHSTCGPGKACRVRVDAWAQASLQADSTLGAGSALAWGTLRADLEMKGYCRLATGETINDRLLIDGVTHDGEPVNHLDGPSGGFTHADGVPTDQPTAAERNGTPEDPGTDAEDPDAGTTDPSTTEPDPGTADDPSTTEPDPGTSDDPSTTEPDPDPTDPSTTDPSTTDPGAGGDTTGDGP
jgi:hypothetical protein